MIKYKEVNEYMSQEMEFAKQLQALLTKALEQGNVVSKMQVIEAFPGMEIDENRYALIEAYLKEHKVGIGDPLDPFEYMSSEEKNYLDDYLNELKELKEYSEGEIEGISIAAMAGEIDAQKTLIEVYLPRIPEIAKLYAGQGALMEDLIGEGNVALATGVTMLNCLEKADEVEGLLIQMVMDAMENLIEEYTGTHDTSEKIAEKCNEILEKAKEMAEAYGRNVTPDELCMGTEYSLEEIYEAMDLSGNQIEFIEVKADEK